ncbi:MAG: hypothetical protein P8R54_04300 [Myxococcota bacterium]|nr:hypothetical protein [Myxococcota bacterium]
MLILSVVELNTVFFCCHLALALALVLREQVNDSGEALSASSMWAARFSAMTLLANA